MNTEQIPVFQPPETKIPIEYRWWSWNETNTKWCQSCWKADNILDAIKKFYTPNACEISHYHSKLIKYDGETYEDILTIPKNDLKSYTEYRLTEELTRRKNIRDAEELKKFTKTCDKCKTHNHLSEWFKLRTYTFTDDVYTQNYTINDDFAVVCPSCSLHHWAKKEYKYDSPSEETQRDLDLYKFCKDFERFGKFKQEYHRHDKNGWEFKYTIKNDTGKEIQVKDPFKK
jgi:hypothetical protein